MCKVITFNFQETKYVSHRKHSVHWKLPAENKNELIFLDWTWALKSFLQTFSWRVYSNYLRHFKLILYRHGLSTDFSNNLVKKTINSHYYIYPTGKKFPCEKYSSNCLLQMFLGKKRLIYKFTSSSSKSFQQTPVNHSSLKLEARILCNNATSITSSRIDSAANIPIMLKKNTREFMDMKLCYRQSRLTVDDLNQRTGKAVLRIRLLS